MHYTIGLKGTCTPSLTILGCPQLRNMKTRERNNRGPLTEHISRSAEGTGLPNVRDANPVDLIAQTRLEACNRNISLYIESD